MNALQQSTVNFAEIENNYNQILRVATKRLNRYLGIHASVPKLFLKKDDEVEACIKVINKEKCIILRPLKRLERTGSAHFPAHITIHEAIHIFEDEFLGLNPNRDTDSACYLGEGLAEFLSVDDPAGIYEELGVQKCENSYTRLRKVIAANDTFGQVMFEHINLNKLQTTQLLISKTNDEASQAKDFVPYWIGGALARFIVENGGLQSLKNIMRQTQVSKKYCFGWEDSYPKPSRDELKAEEARVSKALRKAIESEFGDVDEFEKEWRRKVLNHT